MKENLPFDDFIKDQFSDYSPNVPAHILENIMAKRKSRPKGFWMNMLKGGNFFKLLLLLLVAGTGYYLISSSNDISLDKTPANTKTSPVLKTTKVSTEKNVGDNTTGNTTSADKTITVNPPSQTEKNIREENDNQQTSNSNSLNRSTLTFSSYKTKIKNTPGNNIYKTKEDEVNDQSFLVNENNNDLIDTRVYSPFNAREISGLKTLNSKNIKLPDCPTIEKNAAGNKKYWEVYAGPDKAVETYKSYGDTTSANYLQKRRASTKFASAFSAGVRYTRVFDNGVSVRAGLNYSQVNEKFLYFNPSELKYITVITTRVIIRSPGDTLYINDTLQYQQSGTRTKTTYNRYRNIDIPLVFGYEVGNGKIHANINAGVIINIYSWYKGDMLDSLYQPVSITTGKGNSVYGFKNNIGIGFLGSVSLYYKITDNVHLMLEPYFRYNLSPMSKPNLNLQQKYNTAGLRAGVRFDLK
jgi:hypothetical protein